jgi:hypothetical protein
MKKCKCGSTDFTILEENIYKAFLEGDKLKAHLKDANITVLCKKCNNTVDDFDEKFEIL